jgi:hypothetical protein
VRAIGLRQPRTSVQNGLQRCGGMGRGDDVVRHELVQQPQRAPHLQAIRATAASSKVSTTNPRASSPAGAGRFSSLTTKSVLTKVNGSANSASSNPAWPKSIQMLVSLM